MSRFREQAAFAPFGEDIKAARKALKMSRRALAEIINIDPRYLANIENSGALPSLPIFYDIVHFCRIPVEKYFYPETETARGDNDWERTALKLHLCPKEYLSIIEGALDAALKLKDMEAAGE
jgi:transcriptional regulator with XRE-family HTH domain